MIAPGEYRTGPEYGRLEVHTSRAGLGSRAGHDLVLEAKAWQATLHVGADEAAHRAELRVQADSLEVVEGHGGIKPLTDRDRADIAKTMREKVLDTGRYPNFEFHSTAVRGSAPAVSAEGELTIRGVSRPVTVQGSVEERPDGVWLTANARVVQSEWGIKPYTALLGALKVADTVDIAVQARLVAAPS
jgi:polyisoprenoid-binding protein YceI